MTSIASFSGQRMLSLCVFCGSSIGKDGIYITEARRLGTECAKLGIHIVCGGAAVGLMGELTRSAVASGGSVTGVIPDFLTALEPAETALSTKITVPSMHERKTEMIRQADAFLVLPGGFGTLDEAFEVITLKQIGFHNKEIVFVNINRHWDGLSRLFVDMERNGMIVTDGRNTFQFMDDIDSALAHLVEVAQRWA